MLSLASLPSISYPFFYSLLAILVYFAALAVYRILFHPLAKYPGPLRYKLSGWPLLWQAYTGNRHIWHLLDHEKYGPIVRIAPNTLSFNTASALSTIDGSRNANVQKGEWYKTFDIAAGTYSSFTETDKEKHAIKRKWLSPNFSADSLKSNELLVVDVIERFCKTIRPEAGGWSKKWNASEICTYLSFDIMGTFVFGCNFRCVQEEGNRELADSISPASKFLYWVSYLPMAFLVRLLLRTKLFEIVGGKAVVDSNRLIDYGNAQVQTRSAYNEGNEKGVASDRVDLLSKLVGAEDKRTGWRPTTLDLSAECLNVTIAGTDPLSSVLAGAFFYLVHNEEYLRKATVEVRAAFASLDEIVSGAKLHSCVYLNAFIEETLRRATPVPSHLPRVVLPGGITIDSQRFPAGTVVGVPAYAIHHNPTYFPDPLSFSPDRWLPSPMNPQSRIDEMRKAFEPFGLGTRACIARNLAYMQLKLTLAHVLWRFDLRESPEEMGVGAGRKGLGVGRERVDEFQMWDALGFERHGPMVEFKLAQYL